MLLLISASVSGCETNTLDNFCAIYTPETPKSEVFAYVEENDPLWAEQVYQNWAASETCD